MIIKFACNYKIQLARGYVLSVCIGVCKRQGEQRVNRAHADQRKPKCVSLWETGDRDPPTGEAQQSALLCIQGGLVYIYLARIYAFASLSSYHLRTGAISRWCLMTRWQRNTSVLHARDMSFSSIISLYSSISLLFSRIDGWMDGWRQAVFFTIRKTFLYFYWPYFEGRQATALGLVFSCARYTYFTLFEAPLETSHDPECPPFLGLSTPALKPPENL